MERAVLLAGQGPIQSKHFLLQGLELPEDFSGPAEKEGQRINERSSLEVESVNGEVQLMPLHEMEKRMIMASLDETEGNRTRAAELLGISVRTLRNKLNEYRSQGLKIG